MPVRFLSRCLSLKVEKRTANICPGILRRSYTPAVDHETKRQLVFFHCNF